MYKERRIYRLIVAHESAAILKVSKSLKWTIGVTILMKAKRS